MLVDTTRTAARRTRVLVTIGLCAALTAAAAGCGSGSGSGGSSKSSTTTASTTATTAPATTAVKPYSGPEASLPAAYAEPAPKGGTSFKVAYLNATTIPQGLLTEQQAAEAEVKRLGGSVIAYDAKGDIATQVSQLDQALSRNPDAIVVSTIEPSSMQPGLQKARARHIPVVSINQPGVATDPPAATVDTNVLTGVDKAAWYAAATIAATKPGASFGLVGLGIPVPYLRYQMDEARKYGQQLGLKPVGESDTSADNSTAYSNAVSGLIPKSPDAIVAFSDNVALTAVSVTQAAGKDVLVTGANADNAAVDAVRQGKLLSTYALNFPAVGKQAVWAAYDLLTKQHLPLPKTIAPVGVNIAKGNAEDVAGQLARAAQ